MIKKTGQQESEVRANMRGGAGQISIRHYLKPVDMKIPCRLCAQLTIPPGAGIGTHEHAREDEIYIIQSGKGLVADNGMDVLVEAGDVVVTGNGESHAIKNIGETDLIITAFIVQYHT